MKCDPTHSFLLIILVVQSSGFLTACMTNLNLGKYTITSSTQTAANPASNVLTTGWCASNTSPNQWLDIEFPSTLGVKSIVVGPKDDPYTSYPKDVHVQYVPTGATRLQDFPFQGGLVLKTDKAQVFTTNFNKGIAVKKLRFTLRSFETAPCMNITLKGCPITELCTTCVHGVCVAEGMCQCQRGFRGSGCDKKECSPASLGIGNGQLQSSHITVTSQSTGHTKEDIRADGHRTGRTGWCPASTDVSPAVQVTLDKPMAVSDLNFQYPTRIEPEAKMFMRSFDLLYVAPQDSTKQFRTFASDIPSLNGSHYFTVSLVPPMVTDKLIIKPRDVEVRGCFKLDISGCDPQGLCSPNFCQNGGKCIGDDACSCLPGWVGERCDHKSTDIQVVNTKFLQIVQTLLITTTFNFTITGHVTIVHENTVPVVFINGKNSAIEVKPGTVSVDCIKDINKCLSGFTFTIDVKFQKLVDNTYILSSGGDLPDHRGIALFYSHNTLTYIVTTSTYKWILTVPYTPVMNIWQHFEISWSKNLGLELDVDGCMLGTVGRPAAVTAGNTKPLCIGCSYSQAQVDISMHIKGLNMWTIDRTELVNAGVKPELYPCDGHLPITAFFANSTTTPMTTITAVPKGNTSTTQTVFTTAAPIAPPITTMTSNTTNVITSTVYNTPESTSVQVTFSTLSTNSSSRLLCYSCGQMGADGSCTTPKLCNPGEEIALFEEEVYAIYYENLNVQSLFDIDRPLAVIYVQHYQAPLALAEAVCTVFRDPNGYTHGCMDETVCTQAKAMVGGKDCWECCTSSLCNQRCAPVASELLCYSCSQARTDGACTTPKLCNPGEVCALFHDPSGYTHRCMDDSVCSNAQAMVGANDCWECCTSSLCNQRCTPAVNCSDTKQCAMVKCMGLSVCSHPLYNMCCFVEDNINDTWQCAMLRYTGQMFRHQPVCDVWAQVNCSDTNQCAMLKSTGFNVCSVSSIANAECKKTCGHCGTSG